MVCVALGFLFVSGFFWVRCGKPKWFLLKNVFRIFLATVCMDLNGFYPPQVSFPIGVFLFPFSPTKKSLFRGDGGGVKAKWGHRKWLLQQQNKFGEASGAAVNRVSEAQNTLGWVSSPGPWFAEVGGSSLGSVLLPPLCSCLLMGLCPYSHPGSGLPWSVLGGSSGVRESSGLQSYG